MNLTGRTIVVTGASSGIGRETCLVLSRLGARLILVGRNEANLEETRSQLEGGEHLVRPFDLTQTETLPAWLKGIAAETGPLHGAVHSAGLHQARPVRSYSPDDIRAIFQINVEAAAMLTKAYRQKGVRAESGSVVYVASVVGLVGQAGVSTYSATKGALVALTKSVALELASERVRVNCVAPGVVETEMSGALRDKMTPEQFERIETMHPLGIGAANDAAMAIAFLLSDAAKWITGTALVVDGGYTAH
ncbi:MAG: SDR family NAD(P)-dependent oxidoreductase [Fimbriimonas sp.]